MQGNVLLVDDVITAGTAIRDAMDLIQANQAQLSAVVIALNRKERGRENYLQFKRWKEIISAKFVQLLSLMTLCNLLNKKKIS